MRFATISLAVLLLSAPSFAQQSADSAAVPYQPQSRIFFMPTGAAIGSGNGYVSDYELFMLYGGVGIGDMVSLSGGMTLVPGAPIGAQIYEALLKVSLAQSDQFSFALAGNLMYISTANRYIHLYTVGSFLYDSTWISAALFYKIAGEDFATVDAGKLGAFSFYYTGNLGVAVGFDAPIAGRSDMRLIGELWNHDVQNAGNTAVMLGVRVRNERLSADFGLAFVNAPIIFPVTDFTYSW